MKARGIVTMGDRRMAVAGWCVDWRGMCCDSPVFWARTRIKARRGDARQRRREAAERRAARKWGLMYAWVRPTVTRMASRIGGLS